MPSYHSELKQFKEYIKSDRNEDAKRPLLYPLFKKLYKEKFKIESDAKNADVYVEGTLIIEAKTNFNDWLTGFYQALHYHKKFGLAYSTVVIIAHKFVGIWKVNLLPEFAVIKAHKSVASEAPSKIGKLNAKETSQTEALEIQKSAIYWLDPKSLDLNFFTEKDKGAKSIEYEIHEILNIFKNIDSNRIQINSHNFIQSIEYFKQFFELPMDAVHCFYSIVAYWDITSTVATNEYNPDVFRIIGFKGKKYSEDVPMISKNFEQLKNYIETHYVFTNEGSGVTADYYFGRFDEVIAVIDPEYVKQHGIFFTNDNLSKFAMRFASKNLTEKIGQNYIVLDPAGGSGNLISSWKGELKHKIISELQPDLLKTIERRMRIDPYHLESGFTIIPRTSKNEGLNFITISAENYIKEIEEELNYKNLKLDKAIAFLLNPPYKNTDQRIEKSENADSDYNIDKDILQITGKDAGKERYLAFLGQILNIAKIQNKRNSKHKDIILIFTPSSWLIPRPTFSDFRKTWDKHFEYQNGFVVTSNEFFKLKGKWPLAFTIWKYNYNEKRENNIKIHDYTYLKENDLNFDWESSEEDIDITLNSIIKKNKPIKLDNTRGDIRDNIPILKRRGKKIRQPRYDFSTAKKKKDYNKLISGFPLKDKERHFELRRKCGSPTGEFVGFMDNNGLCRISQDTCNRMTNKPDRVWLQLLPTFIGINSSKIQTGAQDKYAYCAYNFSSARALFSWFALSKAMNGKYPLWANQYDIWQPNIKPKFSTYYYSLCFAFALSENRCVVTKFEANNPVENTPEIFVDNPMCPTNKEAFWHTTLDDKITNEHGIAYELVNKIKELYKTWNFEYCKSQFLYNVGLQDEPYFKYFNYTDFLTPYSGLIQIKKYAEDQNLSDILNLFDEITELTNKVKDEIYNLLINEFNYFE